jgi:hypothetical protein
MLGLEPVSRKLLVHPAVPKQIQWIELLGIPGRWGRGDAFARALVDTSLLARWLVAAVSRHDPWLNVIRG